MKAISRAAKHVLAQAFCLSILFAAVLAVVFVLEVRFAPAPDNLTAATLLSFGALNGHRVLVKGEWYRLGSAMLLHGSPQHLLVNEAALLAAGLVFETIFGWAWFLLAFCVGGLGASLMSLATDPADVTIVGASGAIMGLCAAGFLASFRVDDGVSQTLRTRAFVILLLTLLPWLSGVTAANVDDAGHVGGMLGGALVGLLLWKYWPVPGLPPPRRRIAIVLALPAGLLLLAAATNAALAARQSPFRHLMPDGSAATTLTDAGQLVERYPDDPRAWEARGRQFYRAENFQAAEADFRTARQQVAQLRPLFSTIYDTTLRGLIALVLSLQGRQAAAVAAAQAPCHARMDAVGKEFHDALRELHLCDD